MIVALAVSGLTLAAGRTASAQEGEGSSTTEKHSESAGAEGKGGEAKAEGEEGEAETSATVNFDLVLGWGNVPFVVQNAPTAGTGTPTYSAVDKAPANVQSAIFGGEVEVNEHFAAGVRVPVTSAQFTSGSQSRSTLGVGNVEVEGEYGGFLAKGLRLSGAIGIALPTADGDEIPPTLTNASANSVNEAAFDRYSMAKAAAMARGYEDNALFEPQRLGIIPKVALVYRTHGLSIEPYLKMENLGATTSALDQGYVGELVGALRVGYWVHKEIEVAVKAWFNAGFAGSPDDKVTSAAIYPELVLRFGPVRPYVGLIAPLAGPPKDNGFLALRVGLFASF